MDRLGQLGEDLAAQFLAAAGLVVVDRNWRTRAGELDIVALDGDLLVVCEVKTRQSVRFGTPLEAVTPAKAARIRRLASQWLRERRGCVPQGRVSAVRFDVLSVLCHPASPAVVEHLQGVF
ncbi:MAG: YraN family protein [Mycobacteriales bacterium]